MRDRTRQARLKALEDSLRDESQILVVVALGREPAEVAVEMARLKAQAPAGAIILIIDR